MNTALFLSLFTLFGNPLAPNAAVQRAAIVRPATPATTVVRARTAERTRRVRVVRTAAPRTATATTRLRAPVTRERVAVPSPAIRRVRALPTRTATPSVPTTPEEVRGTGRFRCEVVENGGTGAATYRVLDDGRAIRTGRCLTPASALPAGDYRVEVRLEGTVDEAVQTLPLRVRDGQTSTIRAEFETARLTVTVMHDGVRIPGRATLKKDGQVVAHIGSGVYSVVSAGRYEVEVTVEPGFDGLRGRRVLTLDLAPGQVRAMNVPF